MLRSVLALVLVSIAAVAAAGPTEKRVYHNTRVKLRAAHGYQVEVWKLDKKGANPQFVESILFDLKRGFRISQKAGPIRIANHTQVWSRDEVGNAKVSKRDDESEPNYLEMYVGKDRIGPTSWGNAAERVAFDGMHCYRLNPMYGEHVNSVVTLFVDAKSFLPAGYSESFQGNWSATYSFRNLRLNPKIDAKAFLFPK